MKINPEDAKRLAVLINRLEVWNSIDPSCPEYGPGTWRLKNMALRETTIELADEFGIELVCLDSYRREAA